MVTHWVILMVTLMGSLRLKGLNLVILMGSQMVTHWVILKHLG